MAREREFAPFKLCSGLFSAISFVFARQRWKPWMCCFGEAIALYVL